MQFIYLDRLTPFSLKLVEMGTCINENTARPQHWEKLSLPFARSARALFNVPY